MTDFERALKLVLDALEQAGIPYMLVGSFASNLYGVPRATQDADVVISPDPTRLQIFLSTLAREGFYAPSESSVQQALAHERPFNVIHINSGFKVDLIPKRARPFSQQEFQRRVRIYFLGKPRPFATPEDTILTKLEWAKRGESGRQLEDAAAIVEVVGEKLDWGYLRRWAAALGVQGLLEKLISERRGQ